MKVMHAVFGLVSGALAAAVVVTATSCSESSTIKEPVAVAANEPTTAQKYIEMGAKAPIEKKKPEELPGLHNVFKLSPNFVSGAEPEGEEAFVELQKLGVKTIVSVDSKEPDQTLAAKYGMKYVHIPYGYHGIGEDDQMRLAKTFREQKGPFYVHCFHGKHRGGAGVAIGRMVVDNAPKEQVLGEMYQWCGTSKTYTGLYQTIGDYKIPTADETKNYDFDMAPKATISDFVETMVHVARADENIKRLQKRAFAVDPKHPDVDPEQEALKLAQAFRDGMQLDESKKRPEDFWQWMKKSEDLSRELAATLRSLKGGEAAASNRANDIYTKLAATCVDCHNSYRNTTPILPH